MSKKISCCHPAFWISTFFGLGKFPIAPGTIGSIAGIFLVILILFLVYPVARISNISPFELLLISIYTSCAFLTLIGTWAIKVYSKKNDSHDASEIIIDEVIGQMLTLALIFSMPFVFLLHTNIMLLIIIASFIVFRIFDITKPLIIGWVDKNMKSAFGVILDDIISAIFTAMVINIAIYIYVKFFTNIL